MDTDKILILNHIQINVDKVKEDTTLSWSIDAINELIVNGKIKLYTIPVIGKKKAPACIFLKPTRSSYD